MRNSGRAWASSRRSTACATGSWACRIRQPQHRNARCAKGDLAQLAQAGWTDDVRATTCGRAGRVPAAEADLDARGCAGATDRRSLGRVSTSEPTAPAWRSLWPAPAKLNLFLHVTGRRPDGYHDLQTLFQLIDLRRQHRDRGAIRWADRTRGRTGGRAGRGGSGGARGAGPAGGQRHRAGRDAEGHQAHSHGRRPGRRQLGCRNGAAGVKPSSGDVGSTRASLRNRRRIWAPMCRFSFTAHRLGPRGGASV